MQTVFQQVVFVCVCVCACVCVSKPCGHKTCWIFPFCGSWRGTKERTHIYLGPLALE